MIVQGTKNSFHHKGTYNLAERNEEDVEEMFVEKGRAFENEIPDADAGMDIDQENEGGPEFPVAHGSKSLMIEQSEQKESEDNHELPLQDNGEALGDPGLDEVDQSPARLHEEQDDVREALVKRLFHRISTSLGLPLVSLLAREIMSIQTKSSW